MGEIAASLQPAHPRRPRPLKASLRPTEARPFTAADKSLIKNCHAFMPATQLLAVLNERMHADLGADAPAYTLEQLHTETSAHLTREERILLALYRGSDDAGKGHAAAALLNANPVLDNSGADDVAASIPCGDLLAFRRRAYERVAGAAR